MQISQIKDRDKEIGVYENVSSFDMKLMVVEKFIRL